MFRIDINANFKKQAGFLATVLLSTFFFFAIFGAANPIYPRAGLDPSWQWVLNHAYLSGWQWGKDIVFTFGPWGFVFSKLFAPGLVINQFAAWFAISLSLAVFVAHRCGKSKLLFLSVALFSLTMVSIDALLMAVCIFPALQNPREKAYSMPERILYILTASMLALVKGTFLVLAVIAVLLPDLKNVFQKTPSYNLALFIAFTAFFYLAAGQDITLFYSFLVSTFDIASGYGSAMSMPGPSWQLAIFLVLSVILVASVVWTINRDEIDPRRNISLWVIAIYLFFCFKHGFVRNESHVLSTFSGLAVTVFLIYSSYKDSVGSRWRYAFLGVAVVSFFVFSHVVGGREALETQLHTSITRTFRTMNMLLSPNDWYQNSMVKFKDAKAGIQAKYPVNVTGSVDILSSNQSAIIANDLKYAPRPIFQEFAVYTPTLAKINLDYFKETPPDHVLFSGGAIDRRHPNLSDGYIWPLLYKCYALEGYIPSLNAHDLVSNGSGPCRREADNLDLISSGHSSLGDVIKVPELGDSLIYVKLNFAPSLWGRLLGLIYKENHVILEMVYSNGDKETPRIIPGMAESGFFLDSRLASIEGLAERTTEHSNRRPGQITIRHDGFLGMGYKDIQFQFFEYPVKEVKLFDSPFGREFKQGTSLLNALVKSSAVQAPFVERAGLSRIDAHAPSEMSLNVDGRASRIEFEIGIREGASDKFNGVCFEVVAAGSDTTQSLMKHCFSRQSTPAEQLYKVSVRPPENTSRLYLRNRCSGTCQYGWAFYQNFHIEREPK